MYINFFYTQKSLRPFFVIYFTQSVRQCVWDGLEIGKVSEKDDFLPCGRHTMSEKPISPNRDLHRGVQKPLQNIVSVSRLTQRHACGVINTKTTNENHGFEDLGNPQKYFCDIYFCVYFLYTKINV